VLASLWPVSDQSTAALMRAFYQGRSTGAGLTRAQALRQAQLGLLLGTGAAATAAAGNATASPGTAAPFVRDPARPYAHPFFWAPFVIMGSWL
jgi:CHAT domain-containing protein